MTSFAFPLANKYPTLSSLAEPDAMEAADEGSQLNMDAVLLGEDAFPRTMLLLSITELVTEGFPVPSQICGNNGERNMRIVLVATGVSTI